LYFGKNNAGTWFVAGYTSTSLSTQARAKGVYLRRHTGRKPPGRPESLPPMGGTVRERPEACGRREELFGNTRKLAAGCRNPPGLHESFLHIAGGIYGNHGKLLHPVVVFWEEKCRNLVRYWLHFYFAQYPGDGRRELCFPVGGGHQPVEKRKKNAGV